MPVPSLNLLPNVSLIAILPQIELLVFGLLILLTTALVKENKARILTGLAMTGLVVSIISSVSIWQDQGLRFDMSNMFVADKLAVLINVLLCVGAFVTFMISGNLLQEEERVQGEYYALVLFAIIGMGVMASTLDLIILFLGLETFSIALYILAGFSRGKILSTEAALKYFLLGSFTSAFLLYGVALVYGATGTTDLARVVMSGKSISLLTGGSPLETIRMPLLTIGLGLIVIGLAFKIAWVPFHVWTPDVYEGAPTPVTAFMSVAVKACAFAALLRVAMTTGLPRMETWSTLIAILAVLTMSVGNLTALSQKNLKRMLAYSSIAHAGYLALGIAAGSGAGLHAILFYLISYTLMNLGAFAFVIYAGAHSDGNITLDQCKGLGFQRPGAAAAMTIFMFSLAGLPPTVGFLAKLYLFQAVVQAGDTSLAVIAVLNSVVAVFYYLRVVVMLYMHDSTGHDLQPSHSRGVLLAIGACAALVMLLGLFPSQVIDLVRMCL